MARTINKEILESKIEKAQSNVLKTKAAYERANEILKDLLDKRDAIRTEEIIDAVQKSTKSYDEIMEFLK